MSQIDIACIIDDDPIFVFGTKKIMEITNFCKSIMVFKNGREAIDKLRPLIQDNGAVPEVILLDLNMPIMDGWDFLDEFTQIKPSRTIKIYIVTSSVDPEDIRKSTRYTEVTDYIIKPITQDALNQMLEG